MGKVLKNRVKNRVIVSQDNGDFADLKRLAESCLEGYILSAEKIAERSRKKDFTMLFSREDLVRRPNGFIVGYCRRQRMHIWLFGVLKKMRGRGIGRALLRSFHSVAIRKGYKKVDTITFNKYPRKIILALKLGYRITKTNFIAQKRDTAIFMEKSLR